MLFRPVVIDSLGLTIGHHGCESVNRDTENKHILSLTRILQPRISGLAINFVRGVEEGIL